MRRLPQTSIAAAVTLLARRGALLATRARGKRPSVGLNAHGRSLLAHRARLRARVSMRIVDGTGRRFRVAGRYTLVRR